MRLQNSFPIQFSIDFCRLNKNWYKREKNSVKIIIQSQTLTMTTSKLLLVSACVAGKSIYQKKDFDGFYGYGKS